MPSNAGYDMSPERSDSQLEATQTSTRLPRSRLQPGAALEARHARQAGDSTVYSYYLKSAGTASVIFFAASMAGYAFFQSFPCMSHLTETERLSLLTVSSIMAELVDRGERKAAELRPGEVAWRLRRIRRRCTVKPLRRNLVTLPVLLPLPMLMIWQADLHSGNYAVWETFPFPVDQDCFTASAWSCLRVRLTD